MWQNLAWLRLGRIQAIFFSIPIGSVTHIIFSLGGPGDIASYKASFEHMKFHSDLHVEVWIKCVPF